jgi:uncharacterized protein (DUF427 family)
MWLSRYAGASLAGNDSADASSIRSSSERSVSFGRGCRPSLPTKASLRRHNREAEPVASDMDSAVKATDVEVPTWRQRARLKEPPYVELSPRRVRGYLGGELVVDSERVLLVYESRRPPVYWFPVEDVRMQLLTRKGAAAGSSSDSFRFSVAAGGKRADNAAWTYEPARPGLDALAGHIAFIWDQLDSWFEEDEEVFVHPRDPYTRVDAVNSSRHVRIEIDGTLVAETRRPVLLFETGLPVRYYIPKQDVRMDLLEPTQTHTRCPYKGIASYWSVVIDGKRFDDVVWSYPTPIPEVPKIENLLSFYNEKVDVFVDGTPEHPKG